MTKRQERRWSAVDLTNSPRGLGSWSIAELTQYFQTGVSARAGSFGPMNEVIVNSLKLLAPEDLHAMAVYLKSLPARAYANETVSAQLVSEGAPIYKARCEKCHSRSGRGGMFGGPPLQGSAVVQAEDPASLINAILYSTGHARAALVRGLGQHAGLRQHPQRRADRGRQQLRPWQLGESRRGGDRRDRCTRSAERYLSSGLR